MKTILTTILEKKVSISSKSFIVFLLCPPPCGLFSIKESAVGGLSYKVKKGGDPLFYLNHQKHELGSLFKNYTYRFSRIFVENSCQQPSVLQFCYRITLIINYFHCIFKFSLCFCTLFYFFTQLRFRTIFLFVQ